LAAHRFWNLAQCKAGRQARWSLSIGGILWSLPFRKVERSAPEFLSAHNYLITISLELKDSPY
jgi:hypothetical protein